MFTFTDNNGNPCENYSINTIQFMLELDTLSRGESPCFENSYIGLFEALLRDAMDTTLSTTTRYKRITLAEMTFQCYPALANLYEHRENETRYNKRFVKRTANRGTVQWADILNRWGNITPDVIKNISRPVFDDGINYDMPSDPGLYLVGETHFNPITGEKLYCIKCGSATNLRKRQRQYLSCNPLPFYIDYVITPGLNDEPLKVFERTIQTILKSKALAVSNHNREWFFVSETDYLEICDNGFGYFLQ